jgi:hypothetical protein
MRQWLHSHPPYAAAMVTILALIILGGMALATPAAGSDSSFRVGMPPHSYVTFQVGPHPPANEDYGYFERGIWREVKDCGLYATHKGERVHVRVGNHRITNPHPFAVWVQCRVLAAAQT